jgi:hypothetical protein
MKILKILSITVATGLALPVMAIPTLKLVGGGTSITVADGSANDKNSLAGAVTYIGSLGGWSLNVTTGITKPKAGTADSPYMALSSVDTSTTSGTLKMYFSETGFTGTGGLVSFLDQIGGTLGSGNLVYKVYADKANQLFGNTTSLGRLSFSTSPFDSATSGSFTPTGAYSLTIEVDLTHSSAASSSFNAATATVPDAGSMVAMLGVAMMGLGLAHRRFSK